MAKPSRPMPPTERRSEILGILKKGATARSSRLSELLQVSEMTIRRDLDALERRGLIERTHGGAMSREEAVAGRFHYESSVRKNPGAKEHIARLAAALIAVHDVVFLGEGTTAALVARYLDARMPVTVFTNNLGLIPEIGDGAAEVIFMGGVYNPMSNALFGPATLETIRNVRADKVLLGADALSLGAGMTTPNVEIAATQRTMIRQTRGALIVMADHTKFGRVAEMPVTGLERIDRLVTDRRLPDAFRDEMEALGVDVRF